MADEPIRFSAAKERKKSVSTRAVQACLAGLSAIALCDGGSLGGGGNTFSTRCRCACSKVTLNLACHAEAREGGAIKSRSRPKTMNWFSRKNSLGDTQGCEKVKSMNKAGIRKSKIESL